MCLHSCHAELAVSKYLNNYFKKNFSVSCRLKISFTFNEPKIVLQSKSTSLQRQEWEDRETCSRDRCLVNWPMKFLSRKILAAFDLVTAVSLWTFLPRCFQCTFCMLRHYLLSAFFILPNCNGSAHCHHSPSQRDIVVIAIVSVARHESCLSWFLIHFRVWNYIRKQKWSSHIREDSSRGSHLHFGNSPMAERPPATTKGDHVPISFRRHINCHCYQNRNWICSRKQSTTNIWYVLSAGFAACPARLKQCFASCTFVWDPRAKKREKMIDMEETCNVMLNKA